MTTLADMTPAQRAECVGMWVNTPKGYGVLLDPLSMDGFFEPVVVMPSRFAVFDGPWDWDRLDLLPHLPRAWNPDGTPPDGEWLAHGTHTRVIPKNRRAYVTMSEPEPSQ